VCPTVVTRRTLRVFTLALAHPVAELPSYTQDAAEEAVVHQPLELAHAGKKQLVLYDSVLHAATAGRGRELERLGGAGGDRLFTVDVLSRRDRATHVAHAQARHGGVEVDLVRRVREAGVEVRRDACQSVSGRDVAELRLAPPDQA